MDSGGTWKTWLKSIKDGFRKRFKWTHRQPAEQAAERYFIERDWRFERFGWDRAKIRTRELPLKYRFMPDYMVDKGQGKYALYECKGMSSRKGVLNLKRGVHDALTKHYSGELELRLFIYALPSESRYDVPFGIFGEPLRVWSSHDGKEFMVYPLEVFEKYEV